MGWVKRSFFICCRFHDRIVDLEHRLATRLTDVSTVRAAQSGQERHPGFAACRGVRAPAAVPIVPSAYAPRLPVTRQAFYDGCESVLRRQAARAPR